MKIAITFGFFLPVPPARGGATEKIWHALGRRLAARGHEVHAYSRAWPGWPDEEIIDGVHHHRIPGADHTTRLWLNLLLDLRWSIRLRRALPPDAVVISHNISLPWLLTLVPPRRRTPVLSVIGRMPKGQVLLYRRVPRIYALSEAVRAAVLRQCPALGSAVRVLSNAIDLRAFSSPRARPAEGSPVRIGYVGRLHPEKGLFLLAEAARQLALDPSLPPWRLTLVGPSAISEGGGGEDWLARLRALLPAPGPGCAVEILPPIWDQESLAAHYRELDIFCYPSLADQGETFGVSAVEAMAAGAVPVLSDLACFRDFARPNENALIFNRADPDAARQLADRIATLLRDSDLRARLADSARETARRFDYDSVANELDADLATLR